MSLCACLHQILLTRRLIRIDPVSKDDDAQAEPVANEKDTNAEPSTEAAGNDEGK